MDSTIIGITLFFSSILISIVLLGRAGAKLDREKLSVISGLNSRKNRSFFGLILLILLLFLLGRKFQWLHPSFPFYGTIFILAAYAVFSCVLTLRKLKENHFTRSYVNTYLFCVIIRVSGGALLFSFAYPY